MLIEKSRATDSAKSHFEFFAGFAFVLSHSIRSDQESLPGESICLEVQKRRSQKFDHSNVVFDLFIETRFLHLISLLSNFSKLF